MLTLCAKTMTALTIAVFAAPLQLAARQQLNQVESLELAFGKSAAVERRTAYLTDSQLDSARVLAGPGVKLRQSVVTFYVARRGTSTLGVAYFDVHRVRTLTEVLMIVVSPDHEISRIEVLKFREPPDYRAPKNWLARFSGTTLSKDLSLKGKVVTVTGATLTSRAVTNAARRVLALHAVIQPFVTEGS